jgi:hypothetical protein
MLSFPLSAIAGRRTVQVRNVPLLVVQGVASVETLDSAIIAISGYPGEARLNRQSGKKCIKELHS